MDPERRGLWRFPLLALGIGIVVAVIFLGLMAILVTFLLSGINPGSV